MQNATDREIWDFAKTYGYTIVTFDVDFFNYSVVWGFPPKVIWLRMTNQTTSRVEALLRNNAASIVRFVEDSELACLELNGID